MFDKIPANVTLDGLKEYVKMRTGNYIYTDQNNCALAQYLKSLGYDCFISYEYFRARSQKDDGVWSCYRIDDIKPGLSVALVPEARQFTWTSLSRRLATLN